MKILENFNVSCEDYELIYNAIKSVGIDVWDKWLFFDKLEFIKSLGIKEKAGF
jgi:hypothetical protein